MNPITLYQSYGFRLLHWPRRPDPDTWKGPRDPGWNSQDKIYEISGYDPETHNIGVFTGHECKPGKFLVDFDLDWEGGLPLAKILLPATGFGFGRESRPLSHVFYFSPIALPSIAYRDIDNKAMLLELRAGNSTHQTMLPPSIHPSGEVIQMRMSEEPKLVEDLLRFANKQAIACIIHKYLSGGFHHDARMAFCGTLLRLAVSREDVLDIGLALCKVQGTDQADFRNTLESTVSRLQNKTAKVAGAGALAKLMGEPGKAVVTRIREWLGKDAVGDSDIIMRGGDLSDIVNRAESALLGSQITIYQRGGSLIRPIKLDKSIGTDSGVKRESGSTILMEVKESWLLEQMGSVLRWFNITAKGDMKPSDPKDVYARTLLARLEWRFPVLRGVVTAPTLMRNGDIVQEPGFHEPSQLLLDFPPNYFPPIPSNPNEDDAYEALALLSMPLRGFPFVDDASKSVALSAMLTALVRPSLRTAPLHSFDAPTAGTGKSLLAEIVGLLATGTRPPALSQGKSAEEDEKRLSTVLFAGDPIIHIDNCERPIVGDFLCSMLTQEVVQSRILGYSERRILPCTSLVLASGNNLIHAGDTSRRAVICRLDAQNERPETRKFDFDCQEEVLKNRAALVVAGLTILRAFRLSGYKPDLIPMGGFSDWEWIRGALVWLGAADPQITRDSITESDPKKDELIDVITLWEAAFGSKPTTVAEITQDRCSLLYHKLAEIACRGVWSGKSVGWWLRRNKDRIVSHKCFRCVSVNDRMEWWLEGAKPTTESMHEENRMVM